MLERGVQQEEAVAMTEFRSIPSTRGRYIAGDDGSIWRAAHFSERGRWLEAMPMKLSVMGSHGQEKDRGRYLKCTTSVGGRTVQRAAHRMVAEAWLPDWHHLLEVHHVNGDSLDNRPCNLMMVTRAEHERLHGIQVADYDIANCRLDFEERRGEPAPDLYGGVAERERRRRDRLGTQRNRLLQLAARARNLDRRMEDERCRSATPGA